VAGHEGCSPLELILRLMEGVAKEEGYCSEGAPKVHPRA